MSTLLALGSLLYSFLRNLFLICLHEESRKWLSPTGVGGLISSMKSSSMRSLSPLSDFVLSNHTMKCKRVYRLPVKRQSPPPRYRNPVMTSVMIRVGLLESAQVMVMIITNCDSLKCNTND